jgi:sugar lactone lactonase YvrE
LGTLETVATFDGPMPIGVTVSHSGRMFVSFPKWGDDVKATVAEVRDGQCVPFPDQSSNSPSDHHDADAFVSVQSVVVDLFDRLWVLDTGNPEFRLPEVGGPKLVCVDLSTDKVVQTIVPPPEVALEATYLNDIRFGLRRGEAGTAFITNSSDGGSNGIIVVDLASGDSWRRLHDHPSTKPEGPATFRPLIEGRPWMERPPDGPPKPIGLGTDGIAISADGERLYYCPFASRRLWSDTLSLATDGYLYVTVNQLHRQAAYQRGEDLRQRPYYVFRTPIDTGPVLLRPAANS